MRESAWVFSGAIIMVVENMKAKTHANHANECKHTESYTIASKHSRYSLVMLSCDVCLRKQEGEGDHRRSDMQDNRGNDDMMKNESKKKRRKLLCGYARQWEER